MHKLGLIAVGYNKVEGMKRLLKSLNAADYGQEEIPLIVSIDYSDDTGVYDVAEAFTWQHGNKIIRMAEQNLGLRNHILQCGDYMEEYGLDAVAVFEDDVVASPSFYWYMKESVEYYWGNSDIAGISLYYRCFVENAQKAFQPMIDNADVYFVQHAESRGQIWMKPQWEAFKDWYMWNNGPTKQTKKMPVNITNWPETSWLKYHIKYCVECNKYYVYPYQSFTSMFSDPGVHVQVQSSERHSPLVMGIKKEFKFVPCTEDCVRYDVFFENLKVSQYLPQIDGQDLSIDLNGTRRAFARYAISSQKLPYKVIKSWGNYMIPQELNIMFDVSGEDFFLYDTNRRVKQEPAGKQTKAVLSSWKHIVKKVSDLGIQYRDKIINKAK